MLLYSHQFAFDRSPESVFDHRFALFRDIFAVCILFNNNGVEEVDRDIFNTAPRENCAGIGRGMGSAWPDEILIMFAIVERDRLHFYVIDGRDDGAEQSRAKRHQGSIVELAFGEEGDRGPSVQSFSDAFGLGSCGPAITVGYVDRADHRRQPTGDWPLANGFFGNKRRARRAADEQNIHPALMIHRKQDGALGSFADNCRAHPTGPRAPAEKSLWPRGAQAEETPQEVKWNTKQDQPHQPCQSKQKTRQPAIL